MGFNRREIRFRAMNISNVCTKGGKSIIGCRVMSGVITATVSAHSHLNDKVKVIPRDSLPASLKESDSIAAFKSRVKAFMSARAFDLSNLSVNECYML